MGGGGACERESRVGEAQGHLLSTNSITNNISLLTINTLRRRTRGGCPHWFFDLEMKFVVEYTRRIRWTKECIQIVITKSFIQNSWLNANTTCGCMNNVWFSLVQHIVIDQDTDAQDHSLFYRVATISRLPKSIGLFCRI